MKRRSPVIDNWALRVFLQTNPPKDYFTITALNGYLFMHWTYKHDPTPEAALLRAGLK